MITESFKEQAIGKKMTDLNTLLDRNQSFSEQFEAGDLNIRPRMSTILLTCVDSRVDPAHLFRLGLGDAVVIRNAGGRITPAVMADLAILGILAANMPGAGAMQPELNQSQGGNYILERWQRHGRCKHQCVGSGL